LLLESRILGGVGFAWTVIQFGLVRVALGWHYPSDIAGSLVLGPGCVLLLTRLRALEAALERWLERQEGRFYLVDALFCLFLADAYTLFSGARGVVHVLGMLRAIVFGQ